ncbi:MAG: hypothetical protein KGI51_09875 [Rhodospirillales bacterium]|nr:hypothetical protein [Rhodospirillales bacterium]
MISSVSFAAFSSPPVGIGTPPPQSAAPRPGSAPSWMRLPAIGAPSPSPPQAPGQPVPRGSLLDLSV